MVVLDQTLEVLDQVQEVLSQAQEVAQDLVEVWDQLVLDQVQDPVEVWDLKVLDQARMAMGAVVVAQDQQIPVKTLGPLAQDQAPMAAQLHRTLVPLETQGHQALVVTQDQQEL